VTPDASSTSLDAASEATKDNRPKICRVCGKDLRGHRRIRDGHEYICPVCDKLERERQVPDGVPCAECSRLVSPTSLRRYGDIQICPKCFKDHEDDPKRRLRKVDKRMFQLHEQRSTLTLAAVVVVTGIFIFLFLWLRGLI
jgi:hypothetical protein